MQSIIIATMITLGLAWLFNLSLTGVFWTALGIGLVMAAAAAAGKR